MYTQPIALTASANFLKFVTNTWLTSRPSTCLMVSTIVRTPPAVPPPFSQPYVYAELMRLCVTCPFGSVIGTFSSRGIDSIEIVGLLGSMRTSSISLECGSTGPAAGLYLGGGRSSLPTSSSVSGAPRVVGASTCAASFTGLFCSSASARRPTSLSAIAAAAPPESAITPIAATTVRHVIHQRRRGGSASTSETPGGAPSGEAGGVVAVLIGAEARSRNTPRGARRAARTHAGRRSPYGGGHTPCRQPAAPRMRLSPKTTG